jgi:hypothetical protein
MHTYDGAGVKNYLDLSAMATADIIALINHEDPLKRLYPLPRVENIDPTKADPATKEYNSGNSIFMEEGVKSESAIIVAPNRQYLKALKSFRGCTSFGIFKADLGNNIYGVGSEDGTKLYPRVVNEQTFNPQWSDAKDADPQEIMLTFSYPKEDREENIGTVLSSETDNFDWLNADGLFDVNAVFTLPTITGITVTLTQIFGSVGAKLPIAGLVVADFGDASNSSSFYNVTTASWETITTVVENPLVPGEYALTYAAQTASDVANFPITKNGLDGSSFANTPNILL